VQLSAESSTVERGILPMLSLPRSYRTAPFPSRAIDGFLISDSSLALTCSSMHTVQRLTPGPFFHWLPLKPLLLNSLWHSAQIVVVLASMLQTVASHGGDKRAPSPVTPAASIPQWGFSRVKRKLVPSVF
jgi:hypothetical protein